MQNRFALQLSEKLIDLSFLACCFPFLEISALASAVHQFSGPSHSRVTGVLSTVSMSR
jgi:hypothetical protein